MNPLLFKDDEFNRIFPVDKCMLMTSIHEYRCGGPKGIASINRAVSK
jgi:hypothetical protein